MGCEDSGANAAMVARSVNSYLPNTPRGSPAVPVLDSLAWASMTINRHP